MLGTISDSRTRVVTPSVRPPITNSKSNGSGPEDMEIRQNIQDNTTQYGGLSNGKRKADSELSRLHEKSQKRDTLSVRQSGGPVRADRAIPNRKPLLNVSSATSGSYKGTSKPSPVTPVSAEPKAPPKKGSFAEIMARGKPTIPSVGVITHKPKEKLSSKKEIELQKRELATKGKPDAKTSRSAPGSKSNSPAPVKRFEKSTATKSPAKPLIYAGTAKSKLQSSYKGTMKPISPATASVRKRGYDSDNTRGHSTSAAVSRPEDHYSEEESDFEEEGSYGSEDDYSDMDAGFEDVEEEDEKATRLAKKEDDYERMMLDELKRQKEAKRKRLAELARRHQ